MMFMQTALILMPQLVSPLAYQTSGKGAETEPEYLINMLKKDLKSVNRRDGTKMELFEYRVHSMRWFAVSAEANPNTDPMGHEQDTNDAGELCGKSWETIQKMGRGTANKHDDRWAERLRVFKAQTAKIELCCCLKVVKKHEKSAKPTSVKKELHVGLVQPAAKKSKTVRIKAKKVKVEEMAYLYSVADQVSNIDGLEKRTGISLSSAKKPKVETAVVQKGPGVALMTVKERAAIKLAAHTLTPSVCKRIERIRQWQFVEVEKKRVTEQAVKQGDRVQEGRPERCMEVLANAGYTQELPDTFGGLSKALRETTLGQNMVVYLVDHPMNNPGSQRRINRIHTPDDPKSANAFFMTRWSVDMAHCVLVQCAQKQGRVIEEWDQIYFGDGAGEVSCRGRRKVVSWISTAGRCWITWSSWTLRRLEAVGVQPLLSVWHCWIWLQTWTR